ncbi:MAG: hypothetical protein PSN37_02120 [Alphaproteobacteria bacterium]|nr:hypothetical protein [Alphaproteobacteria bacterium]
MRGIDEYFIRHFSETPQCDIPVCWDGFLPVSRNSRNEWALIICEKKDDFMSRLYGEAALVFSELCAQPLRQKLAFDNRQERPIKATIKGLFLARPVMVMFPRSDKSARCKPGPASNTAMNGERA